MSEKESVKPNEVETGSQKSPEKKQQRRYTKETAKVTSKLNEKETGPRKSRGKKQRRQFKLAPNRG